MVKNAGPGVAESAASSWKEASLRLGFPPHRPRYSPKTLAKMVSTCFRW
jgi:hypothetical protein